MSLLGPAKRAALTGAMLSAYAVGCAAAGDSAASLQQGLAHCATIVAGNDRLGCYDALAAAQTRMAVPSAPAASKPPSPAASPGASASIVPQAAPAPVPAAAPAPAKEDFGLSPAQLQKNQPDQKPIASISASVARIGTSPIGRMLVILDNGQSWELDSADPLLAVGDAVTIQRGALGSFLLTTPSRRTYHAKRLH
ncbi:MAG: hypothetical protein ABSF94_16265 [Steroidobacteraceae bacterium]